MHFFTGSRTFCSLVISDLCFLKEPGGGIQMTGSLGYGLDIEFIYSIASSIVDYSLE
jgi:hypothetical protein